MKIISLQSENIKKLKAVEIKPTGNTVIISGKNGQGKSSVLDSIFYALGGKDKIPAKPIRDGEKKAEIKIDLGKYIVKRSFTDKGSYLEVMSKEGAKWSSPQQLIDDIVGKLSFDPLEFSTKKPKEQRQILIELAGLNLDEENEKRERLYQERTIVGREGQNMQKYSDEEIKESEKYAGQEELSISALNSEYQNEIAMRNSYLQSQNRIKWIDQEIKKLQAEKTKLEKVKDTKSNLDELKTKIETAEETNAKIRNAKRILEDNGKLLAKREEYEKITKQIEAIDEAKKQLLEAAKMPIKGLTIDDDGVIYNGIPFNQISSAEQLKVSLSIAMSMNPKLKVIRIMDGSLLDDDNLKMISEMANKNDYQIWIEKVDSSGKVGFYIEDGEIKN